MKVDKKLRPGPVPKLVEEYLTKVKGKDADWVRQLQAVVRPNGTSSEIRIFDKDQTQASQVSVLEYTSLDMHRDLILYEGTLDEGSKNVELTEHIDVRANQDSVPYTLGEIWQKIIGLNNGNSVFFYIAGSPSTGGPFGRGAAVIELNPDYPGKKQRKYFVYCADVEGTLPTGNRVKIFDSDKSKEIAAWVKERHVKPAGSSGNGDKAKDSGVSDARGAMPA